MKNPYAIVKDFEAAVCEYTGAPYCVAVNSCTMALLLAVAYHTKDLINHVSDGDWVEYKRIPIEIPKLTYVSVPMSIIHAGGRPTFRDEQWSGAYQLKPLPVWDSARRFTSGMYAAGSMMCVSFHATKVVGDTQGGAILHDNPEADVWLRKARFDGRTEGVAPIDDTFDQIGYHCYMSPDTAAKLLLKMWSLPKHNDDLPHDIYPDLSAMKIFQ